MHHEEPEARKKCNLRNYCKIILIVSTSHCRKVNIVITHQRFIREIYFHNICILSTSRKLFINELDILMYFLEDHPFLKTNTFSLITFHIYVCGFYWMDVEFRYHNLVMYSHAQWRVNHDFSRDLTICIEIKNMSDSHLFHLYNIFKVSQMYQIPQKANSIYWMMFTTYLEIHTQLSYS